MNAILASLFGALNFYLMFLWGRRAVIAFSRAQDAKREFTEGSANKLLRMKGYSHFGSWLICCIFLSAVFIDWGIYGDFNEAMFRFLDRLRFMLKILYVLADD